MTLPGQLLLNPLHPTLIYDEQISGLKRIVIKNNQHAVVLINGLLIYYHYHSQTEAQSQS